MKKQLISVLCVLGLASCTTDPYSSNETLADMFVWGQSKNYTSAGLLRPFENGRIEVPEEQVERVKYIEPELDQYIIPNTYSLAKRGDRYEQASYVIEPQVYGIVASRVANKMLADAPAIFADNKKAPLFIEPTTQIDRYLPNSPDVAGQAAREIIYGSKMFNIVDDKDKASYFLASSVNNANTPEIPVIVYEMRLFDTAGRMLGSWSDSIRQVQNDDGSWW